MIPPCGQRGAALLLMLLMLTVTLLTLLSPAELWLAASPPDRSRELADLQQARRALLGWSATYPDHGGTRGPGFLPCPDTDEDGWSDAPCSGTSVVLGRLPWRSLALPQTDPPLWYAVAGPFVDLDAAVPMNSDLPATNDLSLNGRNGLAAVVLAPGAAFPGQHRAPGSGPADWLEGDNALATPLFSSFDSGTAGNDLALGLPRKQLLRHAERRALKASARLLLAYEQVCGALPLPAPFDPEAGSLDADINAAWGLLPLDRADTAAGGNDWNNGCAVGVSVTPWLQKEGWGRLLLYAPQPAGRRVVVLVAPGANGGVGHPSMDPAAYFEGENATPGDGRFQRHGPPPFDDSLLEVPLP